MVDSPRLIKLKDVLDGKGYIRGPFGSALRRNELQADGVPVYEQQHAINHARTFRYFINHDKHQELSRFTVQPNDLIISCSGTVGCVSVIREEDPVGIISQALLLLRPDTRKVIPEYLYYFLSSQAGHHAISSVSSGSVQVNIAKRSVIENIELMLPALGQQQRIAHILGTLDDKIALNRRMNATLEAMARALFKSWFVDFDPVRAKQQGQSPANLDPAIAELFPDEFEVSELGEIPKGWTLQSLDEIAGYLNGLALQKYPPDSNPTLPVLKIAQLRKGSTEGADRCNMTLPTQYVVHDGDVIFSWSGSLMVRLWAGGDAALNQHLFKVTSDEFPKWFYYLWTCHHLDDFQQTAASKATTMGHIKRHHLTDAKVVVPHAELMPKLTQAIAPIIDRIVANNLQSRTLAALRDALLPKLLSGDLSTTDLTVDA